MNEIAARAGDRCATCGTPLEAVELSGAPEASPGDIVLRCANGHELRVHRNEGADEDAERGGLAT